MPLWVPVAAITGAGLVALVAVVRWRDSRERLNRAVGECCPHPEAGEPGEDSDAR